MENLTSFHAYLNSQSNIKMTKTGFAKAQSADLSKIYSFILFFLRKTGHSRAELRGKPC